MLQRTQKISPFQGLAHGLVVFSLLIGQATVVRPIYFVCTMILSQPLERAMDHFLVLLDLSAAFDTIDHDNLFYILEKYVGNGGSALRLIQSYFSDRTQRVQIDDIMSDFASLLCGVPQCSVLGPMKFCLYLLPLGAIHRQHNIGYHIYADDTQLYISFKCKDPLESLTRLNMCISDIRVWMIKNNLKINNSKTEFIIFRSPLLKQNLSDLSVSVGDMQVSPSSKVRDLGVVFDQYLIFHDHISGICKSTHFHLRGIGTF